MIFYVVCGLPIFLVIFACTSGMLIPVFSNFRCSFGHFRYGYSRLGSLPVWLPLFEATSGMAIFVLTDFRHGLKFPFMWLVLSRSRRQANLHLYMHHACTVASRWVLVNRGVSSGAICSEHHKNDNYSQASSLIL